MFSWKWHKKRDIPCPVFSLPINSYSHHSLWQCGSHVYRYIQVALANTSYDLPVAKFNIYISILVIQDHRTTLCLMTLLTENPAPTPWLLVALHFVSFGLDLSQPFLNKSPFVGLYYFADFQVLDLPIFLTAYTFSFIYTDNFQIFT